VLSAPATTETMSDSGDNSQSNNAALLEELTEFCRSESLSEDGLRAVIFPNNDPNLTTIFFHEACDNERVTEGILRYLLEYFPNAIRRADEEQRRLPIHNICRNKNVTLGMVQLLIDAFPDSLRHENNNGCMPLHVLCNNDDMDDDDGLEMLRLLIKRCPEAVRHIDRDGDLPIHIAALTQSPEFCRLLIEAYPGSERITDGDGDLPIHMACALNTVATVKYLHQLYPESINVAENDGRYPIHLAINGLENRTNPKEGVEVVKFLHECNPVLLSSTGKTPLHIICDNKNVTLNIVQQLVDAFPDSLRHEDNRGRMPLHKSCCNKNNLDDEIALEILNLLVEKKCPESVRHTRRDNNLPIHIAARRQSPEFCSILIEAYPGSERITGVDGMFPFHLACALNAVATAKYLYQLYPECINVSNNNGYYPIHLAAASPKFRGSSPPETAVEVTQFLLDCDPNVALQKADNKLPLYWVCNEATNEDAPELNAYLKVLQILYDAHPEAVESNEVTSNVGSFCQEVQTFINTQLTYARQARDQLFMTTPDENGQLPLHRVLRDNATITFGSVKLLVKGNPSAVRCPDNTGMIPLHIACQHHETPAVVDYLIGLDSVTSRATDFEHNTALHFACRGAKYDTITLLLDKYGGVSISKRNAHHQLPIHLLLLGNEVSDRDDIKYTESIFRLLKAYPETVIGVKDESKLDDDSNHSGKKRKFGTE
jgi:ankyrin repeat protein